MPRKRPAKKINLALQGGGAHGAFTWGVLDCLLEDNRLEIAGISGTSAGAMNAVILAQGLSSGGADEARSLLENFWKQLSQYSHASPVQRSLLDRLMGNWSLDFSPGHFFFDMFTRLVSPYEFNPLNINPLKDLIAEFVDFDTVHQNSGPALFLAATNVHSGKIKVFSGPEITPDAVMASACLPHLFQAVEIDGVPYWDGGYMGNPPLYPLFYNTTCEDILLVQINPVEVKRTPKTAREIMNRMNEITFNSTLLRELRMVDFVTRLIDEGKLDAKEYMRVKMHRIDATEEIVELSASSKMNTEWAFLQHLHDIGRNAAQTWLEKHFDDIGQRSSLSLPEMFN